jgi:hypothetical protein
MSAAREKDQADFDLERFVDMFDEAMTSKDPRVIETLRSLMMIVTLTRPESSDTFNQRKGPLRRAFDDMNQMWKRMEQMEEELRQMHQRMSRELGLRERGWPEAEDKYTMLAAAQMAQQIDQDLIAKLTHKINGGNAGLGLVPPKGKLTK